MKKLILLVFVLFFFSPNLYPQWMRTNGPEGISIRTLTTLKSTIFAGTEVNGTYSSTDDGLTWTPVNSGIENLRVSSLAYKSGNLFAGTFGKGVYHSTDHGNTWTAPLNGNDLAVTSMVINGQYVFAGAITNGVYRSSDDGATWDNVLPGQTTSIQSMCVNGGNIFAASSNYTFKSTNNGDNWSIVHDLDGAALFTMYSAGNMIIAGGRNKVYRTMNGGDNWETISVSFPGSLVNIYDIAESGGMLFAATSSFGVYTSSDNGSTWAPTNQGMGPTQDVRALTVTGSSTILAGLHYIGIYRSVDNGASWDKSNTGFTAGSTMASMLASGSYVYAGTRGDGIYRSGDNGDNWVKLMGDNDTVNYSHVNVMCEKDEVIFASMRINFYATIYKSTDEGLTWVRSGNGLPPGLPFVFSLAKSGGNLIAGTYLGVYYSPDDGLNWYPTNLNFSVIEAVAAGANNVAYATVPEVGLYRSIDNGVTWTPSLLSPGVDFVTLEAIDNYAYAGAFFNGTRYTNDYGNSWFHGGGFPFEASVFAMDAFGNGLVVVGTDVEQSWTYISQDYGINYTPFGEGLSPTASVEAFAVNDTYIFGGSDHNGVWRRLRPDVVGISGQQNSLPERFLLSQNYPNPFNPSTRIVYELPGNSRVSLTVYDVLGRSVINLVNKEQTAGRYSVVWDGRNSNDNLVNSGVYFYRLDAGSFTETKRMVLVK